MFKTLHGKLTLVLIALLVPIAALYLLLSTFTTRSYNQEVRQKLNATLAQDLIAENPLLMQTGQVNQAALSSVLKTMMVINPQIELYVLNSQGKVLASSESVGGLVRERVALGPIHAFLQGSAFPIYGNDPRSAGARKVFSVAPIMDQAGTLEGYLYIVLTSNAAASAAQMLQGSYIFRLSVWLILGGLVFILLAGVLLFNLLTRRLRRLVKVMDDFKKSDFQAAVPAEITRRGDDLDQLGTVFSEMAGRIQKQLGDLTQADALRRELIANVSHDLRTPLAALRGYLETLLIKEGQLTAEEESRYLNIALRHSERLSKLISELFELAKLDARAIKPRFEPFSLAELAQDIVQKFQLAATEKGVELHLQAEDGALPFVQADLGLIERVLANLLDNALRHTSAGETVTVGLHAHEAGVTVEVKDTGAGIAAADLPHIFERYYHVPRTPSGKFTGTGLGLAISQRILELHGSHIEVTSQEGVGSSFTFTLPIQGALRDTSAMT